MKNEKAISRSERENRLKVNRLRILIFLLVYCVHIKGWGLSVRVAVKGQMNLKKETSERKVPKCNAVFMEYKALLIIGVCVCVWGGCMRI